MSRPATTRSLTRRALRVVHQLAEAEQATQVTRQTTLMVATAMRCELMAIEHRIEQRTAENARPPSPVAPLVKSTTRKATA